jgi:5-methylcytosine-specific restriction endonuclease McrA
MVDTSRRVPRLLESLGIDADSYESFLAWCLAEELVSVLAQAVEADDSHQERSLWSRPDGLKRFRRLLRTVTNRRWSVEDEGALYERVGLALERHDRKPVTAGDLLRLLWNTPHVCVYCGRQPPDVKLHVDHRFPASRGGSSKLDNLQLLCAECNLKKSNRLEPQPLWLTSV